MDAEGRLVGRASGYTLREVEAGAAETGALITGGAPDASLVPADGIEPADGVRIALSLLNADHAGQVLIEPGARPLALSPRAPGGLGAPGGQAAPARSPAALPPPGTRRPAAEPAVGGDIADRVKALWVAAIGDPDLAADADFFEVGGNSLTAVTLIGSIREEFRVDLSISAIFDYPTITSLAALLHDQGAR
jgi:acyl carrier protein